MREHELCYLAHATHPGVLTSRTRCAWLARRRLWLSTVSPPRSAAILPRTRLYSCPLPTSIVARYPPPFFMLAVRWASILGSD
eukprot:1132653-Rhodomonas_salina.1